MDYNSPIVETVRSMSLESRHIEIELNGALANGIIPLNVAGMANIKIAGSGGTRSLQRHRAVS